MRPLLRPVAAGTAAALAVIAVSAALSHRRARGPAPAAAQAVIPATTTTTASTTAAAPPAGDRSPAGARAAALAYLALAERVVAMEPEAALAAQREAATAAAGPALAAELAQRLGALRAAYPAGGLRYRIGPLAVRTAMAGAERARVDIWYVGVLAAPGAVAYEQWRLSRYDLAWERGAWRVAAESSGPGPRPAAPVGPEPATTAALEVALGGFASALAP